MLTYVAIGIFSTWILLLLLSRTVGGLGRGRRYGNKIARHLGISNNLFHTLLDNGVNGSSLQLLAMLERTGMTMEQASIQLAPSLERGVIALENKFGGQDQLERLKPIVSQLVLEWGALQARNGY